MKLHRAHPVWADKAQHTRMSIMPHLSGLSFLRLFHTMPLPHRNSSIDRDGVRIMDYPVQDGVSQGLFANLFMSSPRGKLSAKDP